MSGARSRGAPTVAGALLVGLVVGLLVGGCAAEPDEAGPDAPGQSAQAGQSGSLDRTRASDQSGSSQATADGEARFPDVLDAVLSADGDGTYRIAVTLSSPYDSPERYADGWRVLAPDGTVLAEHTLGHDHAAEQPFTRTQSGVVIPAEVDTVVVEGRDLANGYGGATVEVDVP